MAFKLTDTGVDYSRGRGAARVTLSLSFAELEKWAKRQEIDTARLVKRSFGRAAFGLKKKFYDVIKSGGGVFGVPKFKDFDAFTQELRRVTGKSSPMGGVLADKGNIVAFKRNGYQVIGWPDNLSDVATAFQDGRGGSDAERWFTDPQYRRTPASAATACATFAMIARWEIISPPLSSGARAPCRTRRAPNPRDAAARRTRTAPE